MSRRSISHAVSLQVPFQLFMKIFASRFPFSKSRYRCLCYLTRNCVRPESEPLIGGKLEPIFSSKLNTITIFDVTQLILDTLTLNSTLTLLSNTSSIIHGVVHSPPQNNMLHN